jgi:hypothetical protein
MIIKHYKKNIQSILMIKTYSVHLRPDLSQGSCIGDICKLQSLFWNNYTELDFGAQSSSKFNSHTLSCGNSEDSNWLLNVVYREGSENTWLLCELHSKGHQTRLHQTHHRRTFHKSDFCPDKSHTVEAQGSCWPQQAAEHSKQANGLAFYSKSQRSPSVRTIHDFREDPTLASYLEAKNQGLHRGCHPQRRFGIRL